MSKFDVSEFKVEDMPRGRITAQVLLTAIMAITLLGNCARGNGEHEPWRTYAILAIAYAAVSFLIWFPN